MAEKQLTTTTLYVSYDKTATALHARLVLSGLDRPLGDRGSVAAAHDIWFPRRASFHEPASGEFTVVLNTFDDTQAREWLDHALRITCERIERSDAMKRSGRKKPWKRRRREG